VQLLQSKNGLGKQISHKCLVRYNFMQKVKKKRHLYSGILAIVRCRWKMFFSPLMQPILRMQNFSLKSYQSDMKT